MDEIPAVGATATGSSAVEGRAVDGQRLEAIRCELDRLFGHVVLGHERFDRIIAVKAAARAFAEVLLTNTLKGADQSAALRKVREAVMTAQAAIALEPPEVRAVEVKQQDMTADETKNG